jgi:hypothetical protein
MPRHSIALRCSAVPTFPLTATTAPASAIPTAPQVSLAIVSAAKHGRQP